MQTALAIARSERKSVDKETIDSVLNLQKRFKEEMDKLQSDIGESAMGDQGPLP